MTSVAAAVLTQNGSPGDVNRFLHVLDRQEVLSRSRFRFKSELILVEQRAAVQTSGLSFSWP